MDEKNIELTFLIYLHFFVHALRSGAPEVSTLYDALRRSTPSGHPRLCRKKAAFGVVAVGLGSILVSVDAALDGFDRFWSFLNVILGRSGEFGQNTSLSWCGSGRF